MTGTIVFWVIIGILIFIVLYLITAYNSLIGLRNLVKNSWSQIDVQLKRRHDLIPNLVETAKGYMGHERETFEAVTKARAEATGAQGCTADRTGRVQAQRGHITVHGHSGELPRAQGQPEFPCRTGGAGLYREPDSLCAPGLQRCSALSEQQDRDVPFKYHCRHVHLQEGGVLRDRGHHGTRCTQGQLSLTAMFFQIAEANKRKTVLLVLIMGIVLALLGFFVGELVNIWSGFTSAPQQAEDTFKAGYIGLCVALAIWLGLLLTGLLGSDQLFLSLSGAKEVTHDLYPQLYNIIEEMKIASSLPKMPDIYIIDDPAPNAFAVGKSPEDSSICVTAGLLAICSRDELQGVVAHEMGHIINRDVLFMTVAATMLGAVTLIADSFLHSLRYAPIARYRSSASRAGKGLINVWLIVLGFCPCHLQPHPFAHPLLHHIPQPRIPGRCHERPVDKVPGRSGLRARKDHAVPGKTHYRPQGNRSVLHSKPLQTGPG